MASWTQQALIEAPVTDVWGLLEDPARFPEWASDSIIEVTGAPTRVEKGSTFELTGRGPLKLKATTTYEVTELNELHEIKMTCQRSGFYSHWRLTDARGSTFTEVEFGVERLPGVQGRLYEAMHTKGYLRRAAQDSIDSVQAACAPSPDGGDRSP